MISIITPTYNREKELARVYNSLLNQEKKNFTWIVVDDGSTDNTKKCVTKWQKDKKIKIVYYKQENAGKPSAYNKGVELSKDELLFCLDSDDALLPNATKIIEKDYLKIKKDNTIAGLVYNCQDMKTKKIIGSNLPNNIIDTYYNIYEKYQIKGDKLQVIKRKVAYKYPFPIIENEKFVPEALINNRISQKYNFLYCDTILKEVEYLDDGLSNNYFSLVKRNPLSNALYFKELYNFKSSWYNIYGYILFCIYGKIKFRTMINNHPAKFKIIILYLPVWIIAKIR